ncbi:SDR family NAD(P)-dependent oxidoreductase [Xanthomonas theicola]|uniref:Short-chain dehydrogenase n=2 Tax=Xanthomonas theicola TaxID=56464 RepID=A0A2S6ZFS8_9XANT|nr:SDR family oxidoreductase [Xanthomonas theicola]PPT91124.1 short-chain dehydrogenase [Xanthomonas theicola]QNH25431.1 SDR family oxidoreductase [Xanthomonas theicola]
MRQTNRVAVITGGSSGMGAACAREFAAAGYRVVIAGRTASKAQQVAAQIGGDEPLVGDVGDPVFCRHIIGTAMSRHGRVDALVNAAGIIARAGAVATTDEQWKRVLDVNLGGVFYTCRAVLPIMKQQGGGVIVNFGSIWGDVAAAGVAAYCASKGAVHNLTRAMALEHVKDGIRINTIAPGEVNTPMLQSERKERVTQALLDGIAQTVPMGRLADPAEIARVVLFMASDAASYMTGSTITVDAAFTAR